MYDVLFSKCYKYFFRFIFSYFLFINFMHIFIEESNWSFTIRYEIWLDYYLSDFLWFEKVYCTYRKTTFILLPHEFFFVYNFIFNIVCNYFFDKDFTLCLDYLYTETFYILLGYIYWFWIWLIRLINWIFWILWIFWIFRPIRLVSRIWLTGWVYRIVWNILLSFISWTI